MPIDVCPIARVKTPVEKVWARLSDPAQDSSGWDATTRSIEPEGKAQPGQVILASSRAFGRQWNVQFKVLAVDETHHTLDLDTHLPLGVNMHNHIVCTPIDLRSCQVSFG